MRASSRLLLATLAWILICALCAFAGAQSDDAVAEQVLGSQWRQLSRRAGMVFAGTVLNAGSPGVRIDRNVPAVELSFRVDRPIAGVEAGQVLTIHEWVGAWSRQQPMRPCEHFLIFLYPPSKLGLTSPVGGPFGQIPLDSRGAHVLEKAVMGRTPAGNGQSPGPRSRPLAATSDTIAVAQLERAIRAARGE